MHTTKPKLSFDQLPASQQRVRIARDVLAQLDVGDFQATSGIYFDRTGGNCQACAKGALFLGYYGLEQASSYADYCVLSNQVTEKDIMEELEGCFDRRQLDLMESAFEQGNYYIPDKNNPVEKESLVRALKFGKQYSDDRSRLQAIMENIIKNKGCFLP